MENEMGTTNDPGREQFYRPSTRPYLKPRRWQDVKIWIEVGIIVSFAIACGTVMIMAIVEMIGG